MDLDLPANRRKDDHLSYLPDEILHNIISLLPTKEAASMCFLSRRWRYVWKFVHTLDFNFNDSLGEDKLSKLVDKMLMGHHHNVDIQSFRIHLDCGDRWYKEVDFFSQLDTWISRAILFNVRELDLMLLGGSVLYRLPSCVFGSGIITTLRLNNCYFKHSGIINLVSLKTLCLREVGVATDTMRDLVSSCSVLEHLYLSQCDELGSLEGTSLSLKSIEISECYKLKQFKMVIPNIESFKLHVNLSPAVVRWDYSVLKTVSLVAELTDDMLQDLICKCVLLENLSLIKCTGLRQIKISSAKLKNLTLCYCNELEIVQLDAVCLKYFEYVGTEVVDLSQFNTSTKVEVKLELYGYEIRPDQLKSLLAMFNHAKLVTLISDTAETILIPEELLENSLPPLYHLKQLKFEAKSKPKLESYTKILNGVLALSVHLEVLTILLGSLLVNLKFKSKEAADLDDFPNLNWSDLPMEHLHYRLKEVEIYTGGEVVEMEQLMTSILGKDVIPTDAAFTSVSNCFSWRGSN